MAGIPRVNRPQPLVLVEVEQYPNPAPRKCIGFLLLISSLLVLRVQQDRIMEAAPYHGGKPDDRKFPWELQTLVSANSSFDATFLALPTMPGPLRGSSTFIRSQSDPSLLITSGEGALSLGGEHRGTGGEASDSVTALVTGRLAKLHTSCAEGTAGPCYVGLQRDPPAVPNLRGSSSCFRFVEGPSVAALRPLAQRPEGPAPGRLCLGSAQLRLRSAAAAANGTVAVAWDLRGSRPDTLMKEKVFSCIALLGFPGMRAGAVNAVGWASSVLFDEPSASVLVIGFLPEHRPGDELAPIGRPMLTISSFDAATLRPRMRYRLPLSTAWLIRSPSVSDGFLLFIGSEQPFVGASFVIDLRLSEVFEQDAPAAPGLPSRRRQRLPSRIFVEAPSEGGYWSDGTGPPSQRGPCSDLVHNNAP